MRRPLEPSPNYGWIARDLVNAMIELRPRGENDTSTLLALSTTSGTIPLRASTVTASAISAVNVQWSGNLLTKLAARDRAQLVIAAYEGGLVTPA